MQCRCCDCENFLIQNKGFPAKIVMLAANENEKMKIFEM